MNKTDINRKEAMIREAAIDSLMYPCIPRRRYDLETAPPPPKGWRPKAKVGTKAATKNGGWTVDMSNVGRGAEKRSDYYVDNTMNPLDEIVVTAKYPYENQLAKYILAKNDATSIYRDKNNRIRLGSPRLSLENIQTIAEQNSKDKEQYLYNKGTNYTNGIDIAKALYNYAAETGDTIDYSQNDNLLRQYYAAYLASQRLGQTNLDDNLYVNGLNQKPINKYGTIGSLAHPLRFIFNDVAKGFVNDNDTIKLFDTYDFGTNFDSINDQRKKKGLKPIRMTLKNRLDNYFSHHPRKGYTSTLKLTPQKREQFDKEYDYYKYEKTH